MSSSNVKSALMAAKLKEGVQDTIVYLRMLEGAKLAPVYERKRKHLMEQLLDLQGDTIREAPPKFDSDDDEDDDVTTAAAQSSPVKMRTKPEVENKRSTGGGSVSDRTSKFEKPSSTAAGKNRFKYKTLEELKKSRNSVNLEDKEEEKEPLPSPATAEESKKEPETAKSDPILEEPSTPSKDLLTVDTKSSPATTPGSTPSATPETKRKNRASSLAGGLMKKMKKLKHENKNRSSSMNDSTSMENIEEKQSNSLELDEEDEGESAPPTPQATEKESQNTTEQQPEEEPSAMIEEEDEEEEAKGGEETGDKPFTSTVEKVTKRLGRYTYQKVEMTLLPEAVFYRKPNQSENKSTEVSLIGAASAIRDSYQFELHTPYKSLTFRTDTEDLCAKWVTALGEAIDACNPTPIVEEPPLEEEAPTANKDAEIPQITVSNSSQENSPVKGSIRNSVSYENFTSPGTQKKSGKKEMPDFSAAQVKGYMHKKGTFGKWEKVWMGLHHDNSLYITTNETNKKVVSTVPISTDSKIDKRKGSDKLPHALTITTGKAKDTFATDSFQDFTMWLYCLEQATAGPYDIQELLSEDEDEGGELYEELAAEEQPQLPSVPIPPSSPRPAPYQQSQPVPIDEDIYEDGFEPFDGDDGDIYEGLDEVEVPPPKISSSLPQQQPPPPISSLPPHRGSTDSGIVQPPSLPPRNAGPTLPPSLPPSLPPRIIKTDSTPQDYEAPKPSPPSLRKPQEGLIDEEVYDDVLPADIGDEETYDDIESVSIPQKKPPAPAPAPESPPKRPPLPKVLSSEELYEDMVPEGIELEEDEEYSEMVPGVPQPEDEDFYDDVSAPPPPRPPKGVTTTTTTIPKPSPPITSANVKPPPLKTTPTTTTPPSIVKRNSLEDKKPSTTVSPSNVKKVSTLPNRPLSGGSGPKKLSTTGKVAQMSKMFGQSESDKPQKSPPIVKKVVQSGTLLYKSPGKASYASNHCVLENSIMVFYASPTNKLSHYRLSLRDATLKLGSPDGGQGTKFTFEIIKGKVTHSFFVTAKEEFVSWMGALVTAVQNVSPEKPDLFTALNDHNGKSGEISFKKDAVLWVISKDTHDLWTGIVGTSETSFENIAGTFPSSSVNALVSEDVYI